MSGRSRLIKRIIIIGIIACLLMSFLVPFAKHEILTWLHGAEFEGLYSQDSWIVYVDSFRVLSYSSNFARVYYVGDLGSVLEFSRTSGGWEMTSSNTVWSRGGGNADGFIWPYFYHSTGGIQFMMAFVFVALIMILLYVFVTRIAERVMRRVK